MSFLFNYKYGYCRKSRTTYKWICDCSYDSWEEADQASKNITDEETVLVSIDKFTPKFIQEFLLSEELKRRVSITK